MERINLSRVFVMLMGSIFNRLYRTNYSYLAFLEFWEISYPNIGDTIVPGQALGQVGWKGL